MAYNPMSGNTPDAPKVTGTIAGINAPITVVTPSSIGSGPSDNSNAGLKVLQNLGLAY